MNDIITGAILGLTQASIFISPTYVGHWLKFDK